MDAVERIYRINSEELDSTLTGTFLGEYVLYVIKRDSRNVLLLDYEAIVQKVNPTLSERYSIDTAKTRQMTEPLGNLDDYRILVAEDSPLIRKQIAEVLGQGGFHNLVLCVDGREAWDRLSAPGEEYDLHRRGDAQAYGKPHQAGEGHQKGAHNSIFIHYGRTSKPKQGGHGIRYQARNSRACGSRGHSSEKGSQETGQMTSLPWDSAWRCRCALVSPGRTIVGVGQPVHSGRLEIAALALSEQRVLFSYKPQERVCGQSAQRGNVHAR